MNIVTIYVLMQLWTNSIGLTALYSLKPEIENKIKAKGYKINNKSSKKKEILLLFVPFYYMSKGLSLAYSKRNIDKYVEQLKNDKKVIVDKDANYTNIDIEEDVVIDNVFKASLRDISAENMGYVYKAENRNLYDKYKENNANPFVSTENKENAKPNVTHKASIDDLVEYVDSLPTNEVEEIQEKLSSYVLAKRTSEIK